MSKTAFWIFSCTWGIVMTLIGSITSGILMLCGYKPFKNQYGYAIIIGKNWGGMEMGPFCLINKNPSQDILDHEFGHGLQNCYFGPFMMFISLASAIRYWYREYLTQVKGKRYSELIPYDGIWFENMASNWGKYYRDNYTNQGV